VNFNAEWDIPGVPNLTVDGRAMYTSSQYVNSANTLKLSSWTRFDLGARYSLEFDDHVLTLRLRIDNVANSDDWVSVGGEGASNYMVLGNPRTYALSASLDF